MITTLGIERYMEKIDVVILGSGPAGLSTALHLHQQDPGWAKRITVIEKARHPRPKLCGGAVTRLGVEVMAGLGLPADLPLPSTWIEDVRFIYRGRTIHVGGHPQIQIYHRLELDAYLAQQAILRGIEIRQDERAESLSFDEQGVKVETNREVYRAQIVVGADGSKGISRRYVPANRRQARVARLLEVLEPASLDTATFLQGYAEFNFTPVEEDLQGYFWDFPAFVGGYPHNNRGVYDSRFSPARRRADLPAVLESCLAARGQAAVEGSVAGHPIHWFSPLGPFARPRLLLVGDAAGADPLFGEGIAPALAYGKVAAQSVQKAFARGDFSFRDYRRRVLASDLGHYLLVRWLIATLCYRFSGKRWFMETLWTLARLVNAVLAPPPPLKKDLLPEQKSPAPTRKESSSETNPDIAHQR